MSSKNLIFICTDQMRFDALSATGNSHVHTPHLDSIAARGANLLRHYTPNQICSPSRATMATGLYPRHHQLWRNGVALDTNITTLWSELSVHGVRTHAIGKLHYQPLLADAALEMPESLAFWNKPNAAAWSAPYYGFDRVQLVLGEANESVHAGHYASWLSATHPDVKALYAPQAPGSQRAEDLPEVWKSAVPPELHYNSWIANEAIRYIENTADEQPFCLFVSFPDPHHPFAPPQPYADMYDPARVPAPTVREGELDLMPSYLQDSDDPSKDAYIGAGESVREQGFMLRTDRVSADTLSTAIAHTYGSVKMIDDAVGRILAALDAQGLREDTYIVFTSDHGEFLGDHGLLRKGPPPYRQLLQVPLLIEGPSIEAGLKPDALTSHLDLFATLLSLMGVETDPRDGIDLSPLLQGRCDSVRDHLFAEYHPRKDSALYNQSFITKAWRYTQYPNTPEWGELFNLGNDPWEHQNLHGMESHAPLIKAFAGEIAKHFEPMPTVSAPVLGAY